MPRLLFEKKGKAVWISHLDLMRVFQRAFKRSCLPLTHTQGYNPRPLVSIALPLSVGIESSCELLDFELDGCDVNPDEIRCRLNNSLVEGVKVLEVYPAGRKIKDLSLLQCRICLEYDNGYAKDTVEKIRDLFARDAVIVPKKSKNGIQDQNIIPMIKSISISTEGDCMIVMDACICCQNPTLNPAQLAAAITMYLPEHRPDFCKCARIEVYDSEQTIFR